MESSLVHVLGRSRCVGLRLGPYSCRYRNSKRSESNSKTPRSVFNSVYTGSLGASAHFGQLDTLELWDAPARRHCAPRRVLRVHRADLPWVPTAAELDAPLHRPPPRDGSTALEPSRAAETRRTRQDTRGRGLYSLRSSYTVDGRVCACAGRVCPRVSVECVLSVRARARGRGGKGRRARSRSRRTKRTRRSRRS